VSRVIAWAAFILGAGASVAANVAHARPELGPRLVAAFAPLALVLAVELAVRVQWRPGWRWTLGRWGGTGLVAVVTAVVSYRHQVGLLAGYGEDAVSAAILPLSVDGLMITAAAALLAIGGAAEIEPDRASSIEGGQVTEQTEQAPRTDDELLAAVRPEWNAFAPLSRYRVEQITGAGARQAQRLLNALAAERTDTSPSGQVGGQINGHERGITS